MYVIIDERLNLDDRERESEEMNLEEAKKFFAEDSEDFESCETVEEVNQKLKELNAGDCGYKVIEVGEEKESEIGDDWICRTWTETSLDGWTSEFESFETEQEAIDHGRNHNKGIKEDELSREFEIYKRFTPEKTLLAETHLDTAELEK